VKISAQTIVVILLFVNVAFAALGTMQGMIRASEESERMTGVPVDGRYRLPRKSVSVATEVPPADAAIMIKAPETGR
jgi:hypothetical protein